MKSRLFACALLALSISAIGCDNGGSGDDGGGSGMDGGPLPDGALPSVDTGVRVDAPGLDVGCIPSVEICGDRMDQDCNGRDVSCGDNDGDGTQACRPTDTDLSLCDCDDTRADVRPRFGSIPGASEVCDGVDNNCDGRVDEAAACCAGCASLGAETDRADECDATGACDCSTEPGTGPCPSGQTCCSNGCTDTRTDMMNCGFCGAACTVSADHCGPGGDGRGACLCGSGPTCDLDTACVGGHC